MNNKKTFWRVLFIVLLCVLACFTAERILNAPLYTRTLNAEQYLLYSSAKSLLKAEPVINGAFYKIKDSTYRFYYLIPESERKAEIARLRRLDKKQQQKYIPEIRRTLSRYVESGNESGCCDKELFRFANRPNVRIEPIVSHLRYVDMRHRAIASMYEDVIDEAKSELINYLPTIGPFTSSAQRTNRVIQEVAQSEWYSGRYTDTLGYYLPFRVIRSVSEKKDTMICVYAKFNKRRNFKEFRCCISIDSEEQVYDENHLDWFKQLLPTPPKTDLDEVMGEVFADMERDRIMLRVRKILQ